MFLEYILTDEEAYHLMYNGVEGVNYALTEDGKVGRALEVRRSVGEYWNH